MHLWWCPRRNSANLNGADQGLDGFQYNEKSEIELQKGIKSLNYHSAARHSREASTLMLQGSLPNAAYVLDGTLQNCGDRNAEDEPLLNNRNIHAPSPERTVPTSTSRPRSIDPANISIGLLIL